jgi:hypothetical protein
LSLSLSILFLSLYKKLLNLDPALHNGEEELLSLKEESFPNNADKDRPATKAAADAARGGLMGPL